MLFIVQLVCRSLKSHQNFIIFKNHIMAIFINETKILEPNFCFVVNQKVVFTYNSILSDICVFEVF